MNKLKTNFQNWNLPSNPTLVMWTGIVASITAFSDQFITFLHEAPFPVASEVDLWIKWILKGATIALSFLSIFTKHDNNLK